MYKENHIGILLDGTRLTQVAQLRAFTLESFTIFHVTTQLRQRQDRNIQLFGQSLQRTRDRRNLLLTTTKSHTISIHQLKIVDHDHLHALFANKSTSLRSQLENREGRRIIHIDRRARKQTQLRVETLPLFAVQLSVQNLTTRNLTDVRDQTVDKLDVIHF